MSLPYEHKLIKRAKQLRKETTKQENHLWYDFLKNYPLRFQRQKSIGNYIVDFYCHQAKLVIELDGSQHYEPDAVRYDEERTRFLEMQGLHVLRILNMDVDRNFEGVCLLIDRTVGERCDSLSRLR